MKLFIPKEYFTKNSAPPRLFLCTTSGKKISELHNYETSLDAKWNSYAELSFSIGRTYVDVLTGETKIDPAFDKAEGLRQVIVENMGKFIIQDPDTTHSDSDTKKLSCFSLEYSTGSKYLENFKINKGDVDSKEILYNESIYGTDYSMDNLYKKAFGLAYDPYEKYYIQKYTDTDSYTWEQVEIRDESVYNTYDGSTVEKTLYVRNYKNIQFYNKTNPKLSLLHYVLEKVPEWRIGHVDQSLWRKERSFDEERIAIYDFLMNEVSDTFKCAVIWDTLNMTVNFYEEADDGINEDGTIQSIFNSDVYISRSNLAESINIKYSSDNIKTKLKVSGADDITIREANLGKNYIMNLDFYHNLEWMDQDVFEAYNNYLEAVDEYSPQYTETVQKWVAAYNRYNDLMNAVPVEGNVVLVGDKFEKLYCTYAPVDTAYLNKTLTSDDINTTVSDLYSDETCTTSIDKRILSDGDTFVAQGYSFRYVLKDDNYKCIRYITEDTALSELQKKLKQYHVYEDTKANKSDNILLRLKNDNSDIATIRIYNSNTIDSPNYMIQKLIVASNSGIESTETYTLKQWIQGILTAEKMSVEGYKVQYIGTMGAYFVLNKDERVKANLLDYGVKLLQEKQDIYTTIFQAQTEAMFSQEKYQCTVSDEEPTGTIPEGTRWLDSDSSPVKLYEYKNNNWVQISGEIPKEDQDNYENYQRYIDNYEKLKSVQEILVKKEREAEYCLDGYVVSSKRIDISTYDDTYHSPSGQSLEADMQRVAETHFKDYTITRKDLDTSFPLYTFTTSFDPKSVFAVYLKGTTPYVAYKDSRGVYQMIMDWISQKTELENFFTENQWIRLSPLIREDEFSDSNILLNGLESEEERLSIYKELIDLAEKELKTLSQPSLEFSMDMANILALPEFEPLVNQFQLGNFVRVHIRDGYIKRARLLEVHLNFDNLSDFSANFGNLVTTKSEIDLHADLLKQALQAGKSVATNSSSWQKAVDKSNALEKAITDGLQDCVISVGKASGQAISWDHTGMHFRKYLDGSTTEFEPEEMAIINNALVATNDSWRTSKAAFGKYIVNGEERWGPIAECVTAGYIQGSVIEGGSLKIGGSQGKFVVSEDGSVQILGPDGDNAYASQSSVQTLENARRYRVELTYDKSTLFSDPDSDCTITCTVYDWDNDVTQILIDNSVTFEWKIISNLPTDNEWNDQHKWNAPHGINNLPPNKITITNADIPKSAQIECHIQFDDEILKPKEGE